MKKQVLLEKVYGFTNENMQVLKDVYSFDDANVLTVLGSGDQYFTALLNGAKCVDTFDVNLLAWYHFILKFTAIKVLSYEDFYRMFITDDLNNLEIYAKIRPHLPEDIRAFYEELLRLNRKFSSIKIINIIFNAQSNTVIPYFAKDVYYRLQSILQNSAPPTFYNCNLTELPSVLNKTYDLALLSNIYHYIGINPDAYYAFLSKFPSLTIEALYTWALSKEEKRGFLSNGFTIKEVPGVLKGNDYILSLTRKKQ